MIVFVVFSFAGNEANMTRSVTVVAPTFISITLENNATTLNIGEKATLTLLGTYPDNSTKVLTKNIEYIITPSQSVELNASTLTALKDGTVTLQAKVGTLLSNMLTLDIAWVVDGYTLPPEPDEALNNATLLGIDSNNNGVRDDVERWIYETYDEYIPCHQELDGEETLPSGQVIQFGKEVCEDKPVPYHPVVRAVAMQGARAAQIIIQETERARETMKYFDAAQDCGMVIGQTRKRIFNGKEYKLFKDDPISESEGMINKMFNTIQRARAYGKYNFNLSGGVYDLPTDDVMLQGCSMEVHKLLEGLK